MLKWIIKAAQEGTLEKALCIDYATGKQVEVLCLRFQEENGRKRLKPVAKIFRNNDHACSEVSPPQGYRTRTNG
jgi:hypothetical protein